MTTKDQILQEQKEQLAAIKERFIQKLEAAIKRANEDEVTPLHVQIAQLRMSINHQKLDAARANGIFKGSILRSKNNNER